LKEKVLEIEKENEKLGLKILQYKEKVTLLK